MDFRTEWSSWVLVLLMMCIAYYVYPNYSDGGVPMLLLQVIGLPIASIAIASIPVLIVCYFLKIIPDIDYSIRLAFLYTLYFTCKSFNRKLGTIFLFNELGKMIHCQLN